MKRVILAVMLAMPAVAQRHVERAPVVTLVPIGIWPLCLVGIPMPGCRSDMPATYMVSGSGTVTATLISGDVVVRRVDGGTVDFGGVVVRYTVR